MGRYQMSERKLPRFEPTEHSSSCAVHDMKPGACDCGVVKAAAANDHKPYNPSKEAMLDEVAPDYDARRDALVERARAHRDERARAKVEEGPGEDMPEAVKALPTEPTFYVVALLDERENGVVYADESMAKQAAIDRSAMNPGRTVLVMKAIAAYSTPRPTVSSVPLDRVLQGA